MPAPEISAFGGAGHAIGDTGLEVDGAGFGAFPGSLWIFENADRTGAADELVFGPWNDLQVLGVEIPAGVTNTPGTRYLYLQREDLAWSDAFPFTLVPADVLESSWGSSWGTSWDSTWGFPEPPPVGGSLVPGGVLTLVQYPTATADLQVVP